MQVLANVTVIPSWLDEIGAARSKFHPVKSAIAENNSVTGIKPFSSHIPVYFTGYSSNWPFVPIYIVAEAGFVPAVVSSKLSLDGVFEKYQNRRSFVEKIYCPNEYPSEIIEGTTSPGSESLGTTYFTKCMFKITDVNEDFDLIFNINDNALPEDYVTEMNFFDVWDRHSCKVFSNIASDSNRGYVGNSQIVFMPIKYFKINSTDKKFYIDFYNSRNIKCPSVLPYKKKENGSTLNEPFVIELQLMQNEKLLYI